MSEEPVPVFDIQGIVTNIQTGNPIPGATVKVAANIDPGQTAQTLITDAHGYYHYRTDAFRFWADGMNLVTSCFFTISASASGYAGYAQSKEILAYGTHTINFQLEPIAPTPVIPPITLPPVLAGGPVMSMISNIRAQASARRAKMGIPSLGILSRTKAAPVTQALPTTTIKTY